MTAKCFKWEWLKVWREVAIDLSKFIDLKGNAKDSLLF